MVDSRKHHYIPQFYQRGFTNPEGNLVVYDKRTRRFTKDRSPKSIFYAPHLNSAFLQDGLEHHFETVLAQLDDKWAKVIAELQRLPIQQAMDALDPYRTAQLLHFALVLIWRHPSAGEEFLAAFDQLGVRSRRMELDRHIQIEHVPDAEATAGIRRFFADPEWQKFAKFSIPFSVGIAEEIGVQGAWVKLYPVEPTNWNFLLGDRPVVTKTQNAASEHFYEAYLFPLSAKRLVLVAERSAYFLDGGIADLINMNILHQSVRYVCSPDEAVLRDAVDRYYSLPLRGADLSQLNGCLFRQIDWCSTFQTYEDFNRAWLARFGNPQQQLGCSAWARARL